MKKNLITKRKLTRLCAACGTLCTPEHLDYYSTGIGSSSLFIPDKIHIWHVQGDLAETPVKQHSRYVLKIVLAGENISVLDRHSLKLKTGQALLIFPYQSHSNIRVENSSRTPEFLLVNFLPGSVCSTTLDILKNHVIDLTDKDAELLLDLLESGKCSPKLDHHDTGIILAWLLHRFQHHLQIDGKTSSGAETLEKKIDEYIRCKFNQKLTLQMICEHFNISRSTLQRIFALKSTKRSPGAQIRFLKLQQSLEWIMHSENSIKEIALFCGYADQFTFSRAFKKMFHKSPSTVRKENRK